MKVDLLLCWYLFCLFLSVLYTSKTKLKDREPWPPGDGRPDEVALDLALDLTLHVRDSVIRNRRTDSSFRNDSIVDFSRTTAIFSGKRSTVASLWIGIPPKHVSCRHNVILYYVYLQHLIILVTSSNGSVVNESNLFR